MASNISTAITEIKTETPVAVLVPCAATERIGCKIVHRAVALVTDAAPEVAVQSPNDCPHSVRSFVVAVDGSSQCQACGPLRSLGVKPGLVVSAPAVLAKRGLLKPGMDVHVKKEELAHALAAAIQDALSEVIAQARERSHYRQEMTPILERFQGIWSKIEALPSPNGAASPEDRARIELLAKRARNLFMRFDEVIPPSQWAEPHDLFQDALLCIAYACEGWVTGDAPRFDQNLEKARVQLRPLMRRLES